ncbi:MAG TPA: prolyl oligopeptidase family serine peptidase, partial [Candidatus Dormibacteraeota bacterium]|nr:prolyl oligopeptidase family serine peptidase [Candidatus Dormibacteraeota bacterium]
RSRRMTRIDWRLDGVGYRDRWDHCFVCQARPGSRPQQLTRGDYGVRHLTWTPDGGHLAFVADRGPAADLQPCPSVWAVPVAGGAPTEILALRGFAERPAFSPDGRWLAVVGVDQPQPLDDQLPQLFVGPATGGGPAVALAPALDRPVGVWADSDLCGWMAETAPGPHWRGGAEVVALVTDAGRVAPWAFPVSPAGGAGGPPRPLAGGEIGAYALGVAGGRVMVLGTLGQRAGELMTVAGPATARAPAIPPLPRTHSTLGSTWQRRLPPAEVVELRAPGAGGPVAAMVVSPPGAGSRALPTILDIHGGPLGAWGPAPPLEAFLLAGRGYRVLLPNPRGSAGYGRAWTGALLGAWGTVDAADVLAAVDELVARGWADPHALGVMGLSYGGFLTQWLVTTTGRFRAAVAENGVSNQVAAWAMSDTGPEYCRAGQLGDPLTAEGVAHLWRQSPLARVAEVRTPLLLLQAGADLRCPPQDNEQFFIALRVLRREVEYVVYPQESHLYAAVGRPDRRIDRMERVLAWFDRHLSGAAPAAP